MTTNEDQTAIKKGATLSRIMSEENKILSPVSELTFTFENSAIKGTPTTTKPLRLPHSKGKKKHKISRRKIIEALLTPIKT